MCRESETRAAAHLRSVCFLLALSVTSVAATAQVQWTPGTPRTSQAVSRASVSAAGVRPKSGLTTGSAVRSVTQVSQVGYVTTARTQTTPPPEPAVAASDTASASPEQKVKAPAFLDLTDEAPDSATAGVMEQTQSDMLIRLGTWTVIVMCLCGLTVLAVRRWQTKHGMLPATRGQSQIVETVVLGPNRSISLVELRGVQALVGIDASGIQSIVPITPSFPDLLGHADSEAVVSPSANSHPESPV